MDGPCSSLVINSMGHQRISLAAKVGDPATIKILIPRSFLPSAVDPYTEKPTRDCAGHLSRNILGRGVPGKSYAADTKCCKLLSGSTIESAICILPCKGCRPDRNDPSEIPNGGTPSSQDE